MLARLFLQCRPLLNRYFLRRRAAAWEAEDLVQEVYLRLQRCQVQAGEIANPEAYLFTIASNLLKEQALRHRHELRGAAPLDEVEVDLAVPFEGDHEVHAEQRRPSPEVLADLHGGERAQVNARGEVAAVHTHADLAEATAWLPDGATLHDLPLAEVARRFNAYTSTPLAIEDPALAARRVSGVFHLRDPEAFLAYLGSLPGARIEREPDRIRVLASR